MTKIFYAGIHQLFAWANFIEAQRYISLERLSKLSLLKQFEDKIRSVLGELLVRYAICTNSKIKNRNIEFMKSKYGKLYLLGNEQLYFNISHSGDYVLCGISDKEIGVDIEKINDTDIRIAQNFCQPSEYKKLLRFHSKQLRLKFFYDTWCLKESYVKYRGKGLRIPLNSFSVFSEEQGFVRNMNGADLRIISCIKGYSTAICCSSTMKIFPVISLDVENVIKTLRMNDG